MTKAEIVKTLVIEERKTVKEVTPESVKSVKKAPKEIEQTS
jgi:hypothetical protein